MIDHMILDKYPNYVIFRDGDVWNISGEEPRFVSAFIDTNGYKMCNIHDLNGKRVKILIHRYLGLAFIPNPYNLQQIDHIDTCKLNNDLSNLRWVSRSQNIRNRSTFQRNENSPQCGLKFVSWHKSINKWQGRITIEGNEVYIGIDDNPRRLYVECLKRLYRDSKDLEFECQTVREDINRYVINNEQISYEN